MCYGSHMNIDAKRYYALLGLDPACSDEDIRAAFRRRAKEVHPDSQSGSVSAFIRLKRAYDTLSDPVSRARYDRANNSKVRRAIRATDVPTMPRRGPRPGGVGLMRYFVAFLFMGGVSFGAIEAMISYADGPSPIVPHPVSLLATETAKETTGHTAAAAPTGFWDPANPTGVTRDTVAEEAAHRSKSARALGNLANP